MRVRLNDSEFGAVCDLVTTHLGLEFPAERKDMLSRNLTLAAGAFGFQELSPFIQWLVSANLRKNQIETLASYLTISETFFWRESGAFSALTDYILPELVISKMKTGKNIRIWSAGCSTGEEPYSLAIAIYRTIPNLKDWDIRIMATDINPKALRKAEAGIYGKWSFRDCPEWLKSGYFKALGDGRYEINPAIREMVKFSKLNLTEDAFPSPVNDMNSMDIIFCRNVLMYFTEEWVHKISGKLFHTLAKDGWFAVASCELSSQLFPDFEIVNFPGAIIYRKGLKEFSSTFNALKAGTGDDTTNSIITNRTVSVDTVYTFPVPVSEVPLNVLKPNALYTKPNDSELKSKITDAEVLKKLSKTEQTDIKIAEIRLLANSGSLLDALALCNKEIANNKLSVGLYALRALIFQELDKPVEAIDSLKKAIYLDSNFIMGYFALGNLYIGQEKLKNAKIYFKNVLALLSTLSDDEILSESDGLSVKNIKDIVENNMKKL